MKKRTLQIIVSCSLAAVLIILELVMYFFVGESVLSQKGTMRTLWIWLPFIIVILSVLINLIIDRNYKEKN